MNLRFGASSIMCDSILHFCTACGLRCYRCGSSDPKSCTWILTFPHPFDCYFPSCFTGAITKGCKESALCVKPMSCREGDLCNSAIPTGPSVILLLVSSAIITLFL
uniref:UPAR/Ly6 domain-containing protein n=1 Tax=Lates calcarifer TaxID=8187 RepID=A0A4W6CBU4_LATCA